MRRLLRILIATLATIIGLISLTVAGIYWLCWSSLPKQEGYRSSTSIQNTLTIDHDDLGVPTIKAIDRETVSYGIGFCHAQDRYFQMDLQRRMAAGELSALVGPGTLGMDKSNRIHNFRERARLIYENLPEDEKNILHFYTRGVNEGLESLSTRPPEYWLLGQKPEKWLPEDTILIIFGFYLDLQSNTRLDYARWVARQTLPDAVVQFLDSPTHSWEAAIDGSTFLSTKIPGPEHFSYLKATLPDPLHTKIPDEAERQPGSNNWVVGPDASVSGFPILASDPHLSLGVPNTWYKASYSYKPSGKEDFININGFTIPGLPGVVIGSNGSLAWGVTNSSLDIDDLIILEPGQNGFPEYKTPTGTAQIQTRREIIQIRGSEPVELEIPYTQWGPVTGNTPNGFKMVRRWAAYHSDAANVRALMTERFSTVQEFLDHAFESNLPLQNYVVADVSGNIAWTLAGFFPERNGSNPFEAIYSSKADKIWTHKLDLENWPSWVNPDNQRIWTANNRVFGDEKYMALGSGDFSEYPRAYQIREKLLAQEKHSAQSMTSIQHDNSVSFLIRWQSLMLTALKSSLSREGEFARMEQEVTEWNGRADPDSIGYTLIRDFRNRLTVEVLRYITEPCRKFDPQRFDPYRFMSEEAVYQIVHQQPGYLLNPAYDSWQSQLEFVLEELTSHIRKHGWESLRWGQRNQSNYSHPISFGIPILGSLLNMPKMELDGDHYCPKVLSHSLASGVRMIVSPGKEEDGLFQMGCGQSGHPFSKHYRDLHESWSGSEYLPFLPGDPVHTLVIQPR